MTRPRSAAVDTACRTVQRLLVISGTLHDTGIGSDLAYRTMAPPKDLALVILTTTFRRSSPPVWLGPRFRLNAYPCLTLLAQCREIVDTANAMDGSVGVRGLHSGCMLVCSGGTDFVAHPPPLMPILGRGRHVLGCRGMHKMSRCCCCSRRTGFESQANKGWFRL